MRYSTILLLLLLSSCSTAQSTARGYYLGFEGSASAGVYGSLDGLGAGAGTAGTLRLYHDDRILWEHKVSAALAKGYRLVYQESKLDLVEISCELAREFWPALDCAPSVQALIAPDLDPRVLCVVAEASPDVCQEPIP